MRSFLILLALLSFADLAAAETLVQRPRAREIPLLVRGRPARPQVVVEIPRARHRFAVGTARYAAYRLEPSAPR